MVLSKCRFILHNFRRDAWRKHWLSGDTGTSTLTVNKMALSIEVSAEIGRWCHILTSIERNTIAIELQSFAAGIFTAKCLAYGRNWWSFDLRWVKISGHTEQLGPCGSTSYFVNNRHSRVKTQGVSCIRGFGQTDGRRKFELGIPQSRDASYIRGAAYIRDKTVFMIIEGMKLSCAHIFICVWTQPISTSTL